MKKVLLLVLAIFFGVFMADAAAPQRSDKIYDQITIQPGTPSEEFKNAGCLVKVPKRGKDYFVMVDDTDNGKRDWSPAGGKPETKADGTKEKSPETAGGETLEELFGDQIGSDPKMARLGITVYPERVSFSNGRFYMHRCELNSFGERQLLKLAGPNLTYEKQDGATDSNNPVTVQLFPEGELPQDNSSYRFPEQGPLIRDFAAELSKKKP